MSKSDSTFYNEVYIKNKVARCIDTYMKLLKICLLSSDALEFAKLIHEQNIAHHAAHLN